MILLLWLVVVFIRFGLKRVIFFWRLKRVIILEFVKLRIVIFFLSLNVLKLILFYGMLWMGVDCRLLFDIVVYYWDLVLNLMYLEVYKLFRLFFLIVSFLYFFLIIVCFFWCWRYLFLGFGGYVIEICMYLD